MIDWIVLPCAVAALVLIARWMCASDPDQERAKWEAQQRKR